MKLHTVTTRGFLRAAEQFDPKERILKRRTGIERKTVYLAEQFDPKERILKPIIGRREYCGIDG